MPKLNKEIVSKTIIGHKKGEAFAKKEGLQELRLLSPKKSLAIFTSLWQTWDKNKQKADLEKLDRQKIKHLIARRKKIDQLSRWKQSA